MSLYTHTLYPRFTVHHVYQRAPLYLYTYIFQVVGLVYQPTQWSVEVSLSKTSHPDCSDELCA